MRFSALSLLAACAFPLSQCAPESGLSPVVEVAAAAVESTQPPAPVSADPTGSRLDYQDAKGNEYVYKLYSLGAYTFTKLSAGGRVVAEDTGRWSYEATGPKTARLTFDGGKVWELRFTSPHRATAKRAGYSRRYTFSFEWM